jgi:hypothetical protein
MQGREMNLLFSFSFFLFLFRFSQTDGLLSDLLELGFIERIFDPEFWGVRA